MKHFARTLVAAAARNAACRLSPATGTSAFVRPCARAVRPLGVQTTAAIRGLSTSAPLRANGAADSDLSHTLSEEITYETTQAAEEGEPEFIQAFTNKTGFKLKTKTGEQRVVMTKQFGSETIKVEFD
ncbi:hypothetical protein IWW55_007106, partial [Coemansia sp. RSA 2706]